MAPSILTPEALPRLPDLPLRRFSVEEYRRMGEAGVLTEDDRVELLEGWIVHKMVHNPRHDATVDRIDEVVRKLLPEGWRIRIQSAIMTGDSEPEPDIAIVAGQAATYASRHPGPSDIALVIEVVDSSVKQDRETKGRLYARGGIRCYWIVSLPNSAVEVHEDPSGPGPDPAYRTQRVYVVTDSVPLSLAGKEIGPIPVASLFPG